MIVSTYIVARKACKFKQLSTISDTNVLYISNVVRLSCQPDRRRVFLLTKTVTASVGQLLALVRYAILKLL